MRWVVLITATLVTVGWLLTVVDLAGSGAVENPAWGSSGAGAWRRTAHGWENSADWQPPVPVGSPPFHPVLLATLQAWTAIAAVLTAPPRKTRKLRDKRN